MFRYKSAIGASQSGKPFKKIVFGTTRLSKKSSDNYFQTTFRTSPRKKNRVHSIGLKVNRRNYRENINKSKGQ